MSHTKNDSTPGQPPAAPEPPAAAATADLLAVLLDSTETPAVVRETVYAYTVLPLWFHCADVMRPRPPKPPTCKGLGAWARTYLPAMLARASAERLHYKGVPTLITFTAD